jgi:hypothetical protein
LFDITNVIAELKIRLRKLFGNSCTINVRKFFDPETISALPEYFVAVGTKLSPLDADKLLEEFCDTAWYKQEVDGLLHITVEFPK